MNPAQSPGKIISEAGIRLTRNIAQVIIGKTQVIEFLLVAVLCEGHVLIEDVPGIGKTTLARTLAASLGCSFRRIQFTPDLLPSDVTGLSWFNQQHQDFEFRPGPIFAQLVLADEINRATPRTQSALLEAMQESQVTADGVTRPLERPFLVLATQNPIELEGTFPLPEAQLDRFLLRIRLGYPTRDEENQILDRHAADTPLENLSAVMPQAEVLKLIALRSQIRVEASVRDYIVRVTQATRAHEELALGASPRAALGLYRASQAWAGLRGRDFVIPDDIKAMAPVVLTHRLIISPQAQLRGRQPDDLVSDLVSKVPVPADTADMKLANRKDL